LAFTLQLCEISVAANGRERLGRCTEIGVLALNRYAFGERACDDSRHLHLGTVLCVDGSCSAGSIFDDCALSIAGPDYCVGYD
jgi:hypothetical protein